MSKLIWLTDPHVVEPGRDWPAGVDPLAGLRRCLDEVRVLHADAERIVVSGDLVQLRNTKAYGLLESELDSLGTPYRLMVGNHDDRAAFSRTFRGPRATGFIQSAEEIAGTRLLYLDTVAQDGNHHGELCPVRMEWITRHVEAAGDKPLLMFLHHPPMDIGVPALDRLKLRNAAPLAGLVSRRRAPTHLFFGHLHRNVCGLWAGHPFAALKSTHVQYELEMTGSRLVLSKEPPGYAVVSFDGDGIVVNFRDVT